MRTGQLYRNTQITLVLLFGLLGIACQPAFDEATWREEVTAFRENREKELRDDSHSRLALVHREYLGERKELTFGSSLQADIRLTGDDIAPRHALLDTSASPPRVHEVAPNWRKDPASATKFLSMTLLESDPAVFRVGRYNIRYRLDAPVRGDAIEIYDTEQESLKEFERLEFFEVDPAYRVEAELIPSADTERINLIDSHGSDRPYYIFGELRFTLQGEDLSLEVYTTTLDPAKIKKNGFMLIFADQTSGKETYDAARYLDIEGKTSGTIIVDFNLAYSPACNFSPIWTCPFPRSRNRLPVAIRAGEKKYRGKVAIPLMTK